MKKTLLYILVAAMMFSCGRSEEEQRRITRQERKELQRQDSLALKIAVMPTLDCLPVFVAKDREMFDTTRADIRQKMFYAQMDCDTAIAGGSVEGAFSDIIRAERLENKGIGLDRLSPTNLSWLLMANHKARITRLSQLSDKMIAMTRHSATDVLSDRALNGVKTKSQVFRIQVNDVRIRLSMLQNNEMDAAWLPEPYATMAKANGHNQIYDSRNMKEEFGVIIFNRKKTRDQRRKEQIKAFIKGYNTACDSINKYGVMTYKAVLEKYYHITPSIIQSLPKQKFTHISR